MSLLDTLTPDTRAVAEEFLARARDELGLDVRVVSTRRSCEEQAKLYAQGRTAPGKVVTNSKGCMSWHVMGRAFDVMIQGSGIGVAEWDRLGALGESMGLKWGKYFANLNDTPHFEYHPGMVIEQFCQDPDECEAGVAASMGVAYQRPLKAPSATTMLLGAAAAVVGFLWYDRT